MWWIGGHLGAAVSALVDGQLDHESAERAWAHVATCSSCRRLVEREGWVKRQLAEMAGGAPSAPPTALVGSLYDLEPAPHDPAQESWAAVEQLERRHRPRRRAAIAAVGVGSVSAAVIGLSTLGAAPLGIGGAPAKPPATSLTRATPSAPASSATTSTPSTGPFSGWRLGSTPRTGTGTLPVRSTR